MRGALSAHPLSHLNPGSGSVDRGRNGGGETAGSSCDNGGDDGQDQGIFGSRGAGLVTDERSDEIAHVKTPWLQLKTLHPPLRKDRCAVETHHASSGLNHARGFRIL